MGGVFPKGILIGAVFDTLEDTDGVSLIVRVRPSGNIEGERYVSILKRKEVDS
jgi:rod shape-determining protein MreC